jgi:hypothetical protein
LKIGGAKDIGMGCVRVIFESEDSDCVIGSGGMRTRGSETGVVVVG